MSVLDFVLESNLGVAVATITSNSREAEFSANVVVVGKPSPAPKVLSLLTDQFWGKAIFACLKFPSHTFIVPAVHIRTRLVTEGGSGFYWSVRYFSLEAPRSIRTAVLGDN